jgi:hypothetical protein
MTTSRMMRAIDRTLKVSVALFILAGFTGALFRMAGAYGWTLGFNPVNIRHAHSHLMYFGWAIPALFALVGARVVRSGGRPPSCRLLSSSFIAAVAAWEAFLLWGYESARIGGARIPVGIIVSTLAMLIWYWFAHWYRRGRVHLEAGPSRTLLDVSVLLLVVSTFGAWGVAATVPAGESLVALKTAFTHLFLALFSEGWLVMALVGLAWAELPSTARMPRWALPLLLAGTAASFLLGMPGHLVDGNLRLVARLGGIAWGLGAVGIVWGWWKAAPAPLRTSWGPPMLLLALKGSVQAASMLVPGIWWADIPAMRVLYLHVLLLGFVTLAIAASLVRGPRLAVVQVAALLVILSLAPMTDLWPGFLSLGRPMEVAAWTALVLPAAAVLLWRRAYFGDRRVPGPGLRDGTPRRSA